MSFVLSIDPSLSSTGYSIIDIETKDVLQFGIVKSTSKLHENERMLKIVLELKKVYNDVQAYNNIKISAIAIEEGFTHINKRTGLQLAKLRGGIITAFMLIGVDVYSQQPSETKMHLGLKGNAPKESVAEHILNLYPELAELIGPFSDKNNKQKTSDIYDAICVGIAHINKTRS